MRNNILDPNAEIIILPESERKFLSSEPTIKQTGGFNLIKGKSPLERFMEKLPFNPLDRPNECCCWLGGKNYNRYGMFSLHGYTYQTARVAYRHFIGEIPDGMCVCHVCDNPPCCQPFHLRLGTWGDNVRDMVNKGRNADIKGIRHGANKLTENQIREIKRMPEYYGILADLGRKHGVSATMIGKIRHGKKWKHIG